MVSCLGESMSIWTSSWTCTGFIFVPRKSHLVRIEYHIITDGLCGILFVMEIFEGKEKPKERGKYKYHEYGNTGILLLILCIPLSMTGNVVILYSGFCALLSVI